MSVLLFLYCFPTILSFPCPHPHFMFILLQTDKVKLEENICHLCFDFEVNIKVKIFKNEELSSVCQYSCRKSLDVHESDLHIFLWRNLAVIL